MAVVPQTFEVSPVARTKQDTARNRAAAERERVKKRDASDLRETASEIAADMETGYYVDKNGEQWTARSFVIAEMLRTMGYSDQRISKGKYPAWWPGTSAFRKFVDWKIALRQFRDRSAVNGINPVFGPLISMGVAEMGRRLAVDPESVPSRDIVDLISKLSRLYVQLPQGDGPQSPADGAASGTVVFENIQRVIMSTPPGPTRERLEARLRANVVAAQNILPATAS